MTPLEIAAHQYAIARALSRHGLRLIPCKPFGDRAPLVGEWQGDDFKGCDPRTYWSSDLHPNETGRCIGRWPGAAIGIPCGANGLLVIDDDTTRHGLPETFRTFAAKHGDNLADVPTVSTPRGGTHYYFRNPDQLGNSTGSLPSKIDVRGRGGFVFAPASLTEYGQYGDVHPERIITAPAVPKWLLDVLRKPLVAGPVVSCLPTDGDLSELREPLRWINPDCAHETWYLVLAAIHKHTGGSEAGRELAHRWSEAGAKYREATRHDMTGGVLLDMYWREKFDASKGTISGEAYIRNLAFAAGWQPERPTLSTPSRPLSQDEYRKQRDEAVAQALATLRASKHDNTSMTG